MKLSRRGFFRLGGPQSALTRTPPVPTSSFSLEQFYAQRGPQEQPPIVLCPSTLFYDVETTSVGSGNVNGLTDKRDAVDGSCPAASDVLGAPEVRDV